jgi:hypothetical protein
VPRRFEAFQLIFEIEEASQESQNGHPEQVRGLVTSISITKWKKI